VFIHFDSDAHQRCDNCGAYGTVLHLLFEPSGRTLDLCVFCYRALLCALARAAQKLGEENTR